MYIYVWWFLKFIVVISCGNLTKPCRHAKTARLISQQILASIIKKWIRILTKRTPVATTDLSGKITIIWALVNQDISLNL